MITTFVLLGEDVPDGALALPPVPVLEVEDVELEDPPPDEAEVEPPASPPCVDEGMAAGVCDADTVALEPGPTTVDADVSGLGVAELAP